MIVLACPRKMALRIENNRHTVAPVLAQIAPGELDGGNEAAVTERPVRAAQTGSGGPHDAAQGYLAKCREQSGYRHDSKDQTSPTVGCTSLNHEKPNASGHWNCNSSTRENSTTM